MHYKLRRFISVLVLIVTVLNGITFTNHKAYAAPTPSQVNDAITKFVDAVGKFLPLGEDVGKIEKFITRLGGITSAATGIIGILQMCGVIKDPVLTMLGQILDAVKDVQTKLDDMNKSVKRILDILIEIQITTEEKARNEDASRMSKYWNDFNTDYTEKLKTYVNEYQAKINSGIKKWWEETSHKGVYVLMTKKYTEENPLTYSRQDYDKGLPAKSEISGDIISTEWSIGIPADYMPNTSAATFDINTYRDDFKKLMTTALDNAIKNNKLASDCGASVKSEYSGSSKQKMLESYADHVLNTEIYKIACEVMTDDNVWVAQVISTYMNYCDNILKQNSGVNAFLNYIFNTYAFEVEVSNDIKTFCDGMIAQAGFYGEFALTCAGQDSLQTLETKDKLREYFVDTVLSLSERKTKALTGHNNYCYITGTILKAEPLNIKYSIYIKRLKTNRFDGCTVSSWELNLPKNGIVDSVHMPMIYKHYTKFPNGAKNFNDYLIKYGIPVYTGSRPDYRTFLTYYDGVQTFAFSEGIPMQAQSFVNGGNYFKVGGWYNIDVGTDSRVDQKYYHVHDKVIGDLFDVITGTPSINTIIAARAFYGEGHEYWSNADEGWLFIPEHTILDTYSNNADIDVHASFYGAFVGMGVLESETFHNLTGEAANDPNNPFAAFDQVSLTPGVSDFQGTLYENQSKDITDVLLESESFTYTGQPIEPAVMVLCSDDVVSEDGYTVTYINNDIDSGDAVVRVEGKGDYSGIITRRFRINSASDSDSDSPINYYTGSGGGCNAISGLGLVLGLVFVFKKLRRR